MTREERIKNARAILDGDCSDELREALINAFPELKESEDERIRKVLIHIVKGACDKYGIKYKGDEISEDEMLAYLEKQKEQKSEGGDSEKPNSQWSEEDEGMLRTIISDGSRGVELDSKQIAWLKSLRPQPHWKPSEEQMKALNEIINILAVSKNPHESDYLFNMINGLRKSLKKL